MTERRYELIIAPTAKRQLAEQLRKSVAFAAYEFIIGALLDNPHRVGKQLRPPLADRHSARRGNYRVLYRIDDASFITASAFLVDGGINAAYVTPL